MKSTYLLLTPLVLFLVQPAMAMPEDTLIAHRSRSDKRSSFFSKTSLSDEQLEKLVDRKNQYEKEIAADRAMIRVDYRHLFNMMTKPEVNKEDVLKHHAKLQKRKQRISQARVNCFLDSWQLLTDSQRKDLRRNVLERQLRKRSWHRRGSSHQEQKKAENTNTTGIKQNKPVEEVATNNTPGLPTAEQFLLMLAEEED